MRKHDRNLTYRRGNRNCIDIPIAVDIKMKDVTKDLKVENDNIWTAM